MKTTIYVLLKPIHHRFVLSSRICLCQCTGHCSYTGIQESLRTKTSRIFLCQNFKDLFRYTDTSQNLASYIFCQDKILTRLLVMPIIKRSSQYDVAFSTQQEVFFQYYQTMSLLARVLLLKHHHQRCHQSSVQALLLLISNCIQLCDCKPRKHKFLLLPYYYFSAPKVVPAQCVNAAP